MGLMDRDYYREKKTGGSGPQEVVRRFKDNPFLIFILALILLLIIGLIL